MFFLSCFSHRFGMPTKANTPLYLIAIKPANGSKFLSKQIAPKLQFRLRTLIGEGRSNPQCAYWMFGSSSSTSNSRTPNSGAHMRGKWSSKGCEIKGLHPPQKYRFSYEYVNCSCDKVGAIGVIMDVAANEVRIFCIKSFNFKVNFFIPLNSSLPKNQWDKRLFPTLASLPHWSS